MVKCVVVPVREAEQTRQQLSDLGVLSREYNIETEDGVAYIPVTEETSQFKTTTRNASKRNIQESVEEILGYNPTYEWIGDIVVLEENSSRVDEIVTAFTQSSQDPKAIVNKVSPVSGKTRVPEYDLLYGDSTETISTEYGYEYELDIREVYFTPRLGNERQRITQSINSGDKTFDMFAGVGPYAIPCADVGAEAIATDINDVAFNYLKRNIRRNQVPVLAYNLDVRNLAEKHTSCADHVIMNLPHSASEFIDTATTIVKNNGRVIYYCFLSADESVEEETSKLSDKIDADLRLENKTTVRPYSPDIDNYCLEYLVQK